MSTLVSHRLSLPRPKARAHIPTGCPSHARAAHHQSASIEITCGFGPGCPSHKWAGSSPLLFRQRLRIRTERSVLRCRLPCSRRKRGRTGERAKFQNCSAPQVSNSSRCSRLAAVRKAGPFKALATALRFGYHHVISNPSAGSSPMRANPSLKTDLLRLRLRKPFSSNVSPHCKLHPLCRTACLCPGPKPARTSPRAARRTRGQRTTGLPRLKLHAALARAARPTSGRAAHRSCSARGCEYELNVLFFAAACLVVGGKGDEPVSAPSSRTVLHPKFPIQAVAAASQPFARQVHSKRSQLPCGLATITSSQTRALGLPRCGLTLRSKRTCSGCACASRLAQTLARRQIPLFWAHRLSLLRLMRARFSAWAARRARGSEPFSCREANYRRLWPGLPVPQVGEQLTVLVPRKAANTH